MPDKIHLPLLKVGTFGTHLLKNPAGTFSFTGSVPEELNDKIFQTYDQGEQAFVDWFKAMTPPDQRKHVAYLRDDIFVKILES